MKITIQNCNNIDKGEITLVNCKLNIKFGINGTGKSTIAKAIQFNIDDPKRLKELLPFKLQKDNLKNLQPKINIKNNEDLNSILVFNEEYLKQFTYKKDELISHSFEIFIKTPRYVETTENIEQQLEVITKIFSNNTKLEKIITDFESLSKSFKTTRKGLSGASAISKGLGENNIKKIPDNLSGYKPFLENTEKCVSWLDWQIKGNNFSDGHDNCPYCVSPNDEAKKIIIKSISEKYDKNIIKNFIVIIKAMEDSGDYFSDSSKKELNKILGKIDDFLPNEKEFIVEIKNQIDSFLQRLKNLRDISFESFKDDEEVEEKIKGFIIKIKLFDKLNSKKTKEIVNSFNGSLTEILGKIGKLQGEVNRQKEEITKLIEKHQEDINRFLENSGYKYKVIIDEDDEYKLKLKHIDFEQSILGGDQHLSFGEKNAFALVLFMYEALSKDLDLIILDDPISSFDKNKKYAIMDMLFKTDNCLKDKTVLMLTHDIEPIIDIVKVFNNFNGLANANFIFVKKGELKEKSIKKENLLSFPQICKKVIKKADVNPLVKVIYLRRYHQVVDDNGHEYQVLSNLLHKRSQAEAEDYRKKIVGGKAKLMDCNHFVDGVTEIKKIFNDFNYAEILENISDEDSLKKIYNLSEYGYEKLQLFRLSNNNSSNSVLKKFINESYHVENELIYQLNPMEFELIPSFILDECDKVMRLNGNHL